jgi:hypothetical protein
MGVAVACPVAKAPITTAPVAARVLRISIVLLGTFFTVIFAFVSE